MTRFQSIQIGVFAAALTVLLGGAPLTPAPAAPSLNADSDAAALLSSYLRYILVQQTPRQAESLVGNASAQVADQVRVQVKSWADQRIQDIRAGLDARFGAEAKKKFQVFIGKFTQMEAKEDLKFLDMMNRAMRLTPPSRDYRELRAVMAETFLMEDLEASSSLLGEIQTWMDVQANQEGVPPLGIWMSRDELSEGGGGSKDREADIDPLEAAEGDFGGFTELPEEEEFSPLESYSSARKAKSDRMAEESKAGMAMVAQERQAWEAAHAEKKQASAQADAAAMKRHAEDLAKVEEEAFQQRQKSWGNRLKKIVASAAGSFAGGVTGGFATRATEEAVSEIWP